MNARRKGNALIMQSGGCTAVMNLSLWGIVAEASEHQAFNAIYGAVHGLQGLLSGDLACLDTLSKTTWSRIARTPGAVLGSTRRKLKPEDLPHVLQVLRTHEIQYLFIIGGNDSADTGHRITREANAYGYELTVMNVPKTIDNDLVLTDHSPGYGSAARFVALATMGAGRDAESMGEASPVTIIEVMGRDAGWLAASSVLAKRHERDAPHLICVPEVPIDKDRFLGHVEEAYLRYGFAVAVVAENTRGLSGPLGNRQEPWYVDDFGHQYFEGAGGHLANLVSRQIGVRARYEKPGTIQRSLVSCVSRTDAKEAETVGRAAVSYALKGYTNHMVTLTRALGERYASTTSLAPLSQVAGQVKSMPSDYLAPSDHFVTQKLINYVRPLVGSSLPHFGRIH